jgi:hypothetical protein
MVMKVLLLSIVIIINHLLNAGDGWFFGQNVSGSGAGNFGISTSATGLCMSINSSGTTNFAFGPTAPTASSVSTNTTQLATTAFVQTRSKQYGVTGNTQGTINASDAGCLILAGGNLTVNQNLTANQFVKVLTIPYHHQSQLIRGLVLHYDYPEQQQQEIEH